jgi:hypothetical protein
LNSLKKYAIIGLALNLIGFALGFAGQGLYQMGIESLDSGIATLEPLGDLAFGLGLVIVIASAALAGVEMRYIAIAGAVIGIGLFFKSALHEIHIASGIGFGLPHTAHVGLGAILITVSAAALTIISLRSKREIKVRKSV